MGERDYHRALFGVQDGGVQGWGSGFRVNGCSYRDRFL